jgi:hypothetical protein
VPRRTLPLFARFMAKARQDPGHPGCWAWAGATTAGRVRTTRYGYIQVGPRGSAVARVHRLMLIWTKGEPLIPGLEARHLCGYSLCVNPVHLEWGTRRENEQDKRRGREREPGEEG